MLLSIQHIVLQKPRLSQNQCNDVGGRWSWTCGCNASVFVWAASWKHCLNGSSHKTTCWATLMICVPYEEGIEYILIFYTYFFFGVLHKSFGRAFSSSRDTSETFECRWPWCSSVYLNDVFFSGGSLVTYINHTSLKDLCVHSKRRKPPEMGGYPMPKRACTFT